MSPEQVFGSAERSHDSRPTSMAWGPVLYKLLTGRPPFQAETLYETLTQVRSV